MSEVLEEQPKTEFTVESPSAVIQNPPQDPLDKPLLTVTVNNPFKKLLHWLDEIRKKQTTTFDLKVKIPLLALPIFLAVLAGAFQFFFSLGKNSGIQQELQKPTPTPIVIVKPTTLPLPIILSRTGVIRATYKARTTDVIPEPTLPSEATPSATPTENPYRYILSGQGGRITFLIPDPQINLNTYLNRRAIITGEFDTEKSTLKISTLSDIELLP